MPTVNLPGVFALMTPDWVIEIGKGAGVVAALIAATGLIAKSPLGRIIAYVYRHLFGEPLTQRFTEVVTTVVTPQLDRVEEKNDRQHAENKASIDGLREAVDEHRLETRDHLFELRQQIADTHGLIATHFKEATIRDERITALELHNVDVRIVAKPADEPDDR